MDTNYPHEIKKLSEITEDERDRFIELTHPEYLELSLMNADQRAEWIDKKRRAENFQADLAKEFGDQIDDRLSAIERLEKRLANGASTAEGESEGTGGGGERSRRNA